MLNLCRLIILFVIVAHPMVLHSGVNSTTEENSSRVSKKKKSKKTVKKKRRRRCSSYVSPSYKAMKKRWRKKPRIQAPKWRDGYRDLTIYAVNLGERVRVFPFLSDGTLDPEALEEISHITRDKKNHEVVPVHPRLVKLLYRLVVRFKAIQITLISGFRDPGDSKNESHHTDGSAMDIMIPGVRLPGVAKVMRRFGHVGVGYYPSSGFVHLDAREGQSFFWADRSGPGKRGCLVHIMKKAGPKFDRKWRPKNDEPVPQKNKKGELRGVVKKPLLSNEAIAAP